MADEVHIQQCPSTSPPRRSLTSMLTSKSFGRPKTPSVIVTDDTVSAAIPFPLDLYFYFFFFSTLYLPLFLPPAATSSQLAAELNRRHQIRLQRLPRPRSFLCSLLAAGRSIGTDSID